MHRKFLLTTIPGLLVYCASVSSAVAQSDTRDRSDRRDRNRSQNQQQDDSYWRTDDESYWDLEDWTVDLDVAEATDASKIRIGYDYDDDGTYDAYGYIYAEDLQKLLETGSLWQEGTRQDRQRRQYGQQRDQRRMRGDMRGQRDRWERRQHARYRQQRQDMRRTRGDTRSRRGDVRTARGELTQLRTLRLSGVRQPHLVGKLETRSGRTIKVDFGPKQRIRQRLDLSEGDRITVQGHRGRINERPMFMAQRVRYDGRTFQVRRQRARHEQFEGRIASMHRAKLRGDDNQHVIAKVRMRDGGTKQVALGTKQQVQRINLQQGDRVQFLAKRARINGQPGYVAKRVSIDGDSYAVNKQVRTRSRMQDRQRSRQMDRMRSARHARQEQRMSQRRGGGQYRVQGEVTSLKSVKLSGVSQKHLCGKIETNRGHTIKVDFGPRQRVQRNFDLQEGDRITVIGQRGRINGKSMLMADKIRQQDGQTYKVRRSRGQAYQEYSGKILATKRMQLKGDGRRQHVVATVRLNNGQQRKVALGTRSQVNEIGISSGDRVKFLARPCKINGNRGLVAKRVRHDGETHRVNERMRLTSH